MIKKTNIFIVSLLFLSSLYYLYHSNYDLYFSTKIILISVYSLISLTILFGIYKLKTNFHLPIFILTNIYFLTSYILLFFFEKGEIYPRFSEVEYSVGLTIFLYGYTAFYLGYLIISFVLKDFHRKGFKLLDVDNMELFMIGSFCLLANLFFYEILNINKFISGLAQLRYPLISMGIGFLATYLITDSKDRKSFINKFISVVLIFFTIFFFIFNGALAYPFMMLFIIYAYYCYTKKKFTIIPFIIITILFLFFHLGKYHYRDTLKIKNEKTPTLFHKIKGLHSIQSQILFDTQKFIMRENCEYSILEDNSFQLNNEFIEEGALQCKKVYNYRMERRLGHSIESLLIVTSMTPKIVPYWDGYSYEILKSKIIPRIFWKNKPQDGLGNEFGRRYKILFDTNITTSWNMPILNEFYVNYGKKGVIFGMFMIGLLFSLINKVFTIKRIKNTETIIAFFIFVPMFFIESHASLIFGSIIQSYIFVMILSFILLKIIRKFTKV